MTTALDALNARLAAIPASPWIEAELVRERVMRATIEQEVSVELDFELDWQEVFGADLDPYVQY